MERRRLRGTSLQQTGSCRVLSGNVVNFFLDATAGSMKTKSSGAKGDGFCRVWERIRPLTAVCVAMCGYVWLCVAMCGYVSCWTRWFTGCTAKVTRFPSFPTIRSTTTSETE